MFSSRSCSAAAATSSAPWRTHAAQPPNSWPSVMGTASCRCVRPVLSTPANSSAFCSRLSTSPRAACTSGSAAEQQGQTRRRREDVVGGLADVDVIVRVDARVRAARLAQDFGRAVGEHFVGVHVVRRAGAGLVHVDDELIAQPAREDLVGGRDDRAGDVRDRGARAPRWLRPPPS